MDEVAFGSLVHGRGEDAGGAYGGRLIARSDGSESLAAQRLHAGFFRSIAFGADFSLTDALEGGFRVGHGIGGEFAGLRDGEQRKVLTRIILSSPGFVDFSGSDWCGWCIKLDKEVFSQAAFKEYAKDNLILVMVDFPKKKKLDAATESANNALMEKYGVEGFPTVILVDSKGTVIAQTGYREGGAAAYVEHIKDLLAKAKK